MKIGINGTGMITRAIVKLVSTVDEFKDLEIVQINGRSMTLEILHDRLLYSTAQGHADLQVEMDKKNNEIIVNGRRIKYSQISNPEQIEWLPEVEILIEATGAFRDNTSSSKDPHRHLKSPKNNIKAIVLSAPGKGDIKDYMFLASPNLEKDLMKYINKEEPFVIGGASCTTTATIPIVDTLDEAFGIESCYLTTIHAKTRSQDVLDGSKGWSCSTTQLHTTGATKSTNRVLKKEIPMDGIAYRTPDKCGSFIQIDAILKKETSLEEIKEAFKKSKYAPYIDYPKVQKPPSTYVLGNLNMVMLIPDHFAMIENNRVIIRGLYDNEEGYTAHFLQLIQVLIKLMKK